MAKKATKTAGQAPAKKSTVETSASDATSQKQATKKTRAKLPASPLVESEQLTPAKKAWVSGSAKRPKANG